MPKNTKIVLSISAMIGGFFLDGLAWSTELGHPYSTISLLLGLSLMIAGFVYFVLAVTTKR